jgi:ribonucleoside-diphosphate reductase alpha chain
MDHPTLAKDPETLQALKKTAIETNKAFAQQLGVNQSAAITTVKPEGTSALVNGSAHGIMQDIPSTTYDTFGLTQPIRSTG